MRRRAADTAIIAVAARCRFYAPRCLRGRAAPPYTLATLPRIDYFITLSLFSRYAFCCFIDRLSFVDRHRAAVVTIFIFSAGTDRRIHFFPSSAQPNSHSAAIAAASQPNRFSLIGCLIANIRRSAGRQLSALYRHDCHAFSIRYLVSADTEHLTHKMCSQAHYRMPPLPRRVFVTVKVR